MVLESGSSTMHAPSEEDINEIDRLMSDGKRNFICNQPQLALDCFVILCEKLASFYGQESDKCVEAYLYYGKTLLEIARMENGVLGQVIKETPIEEEEESGNAENEQAANDGGSSKSDTEGSSSKTDKEEKEAVIDKEAVNNGHAKVTAEDDTTQADGSDGEACDNDDEDEEDVSNMELAWEMFELTSVICKRQLTEGASDKKKVKSTLADAKYGLAQISLETERYEDSVTDFRECLEIYEEVLGEEDDRLIAEARYNIALALSFDKKYAEAIVEFEKAVGILKARVANLESKVKEMEETGNKGKAPPELDGWKKEINELNDIIVHDMMTRIEDAHESKRLLDASIKTVKTAASELFGSFGTLKNGSFDDGFDAPLTGSTEVINDCTAKIRSVKRKDEETLDSREKKVKQTMLVESSSAASSVAD